MNPIGGGRKDGVSSRGNLGQKQEEQSKQGKMGLRDVEQNKGKKIENSSEVQIKEKSGIIERSVEALRKLPGEMWGVIGQKLGDIDASAMREAILGKSSKRREFTQLVVIDLSTSKAERIEWIDHAKKNKMRIRLKGIDVLDPDQISQLTNDLGARGALDRVEEIELTGKLGKAHDIKSAQSNLSILAKHCKEVKHFNLNIPIEHSAEKSLNMWDRLLASPIAARIQVREKIKALTFPQMNQDWMADRGSEFVHTLPNLERLNLSRVNGSRSRLDGFPLFVPEHVKEVNIGEIGYSSRSRRGEARFLLPPGCNNSLKVSIENANAYDVRILRGYVVDNKLKVQEHSPEKTQRIRLVAGEIAKSEGPYDGLKTSIYIENSQAVKNLDRFISVSSKYRSAKEVRISTSVSKVDLGYFSVGLIVADEVILEKPGGEISSSLTLNPSQPESGSKLEINGWSDFEDMRYKFYVGGMASYPPGNRVRNAKIKRIDINGIDMTDSYEKYLRESFSVRQLLVNCVNVEELFIDGDLVVDTKNGILDLSKMNGACAGKLLLELAMARNGGAQLAILNNLKEIKLPDLKLGYEPDSDSYRNVSSAIFSLARDLEKCDIHIDILSEDHDGRLHSFMNLPNVRTTIGRLDGHLTIEKGSAAEQSVTIESFGETGVKIMRSRPQLKGWVRRTLALIALKVLRAKASGVRDLDQLTDSAGRVVRLIEWLKGSQSNE